MFVAVTAEVMAVFTMGQDQAATRSGAVTLRERCLGLEVSRPYSERQCFATWLRCGARAEFAEVLYRTGRGSEPGGQPRAFCVWFRGN